MRESFDVDGVTFVFKGESSRNRFCIGKPGSLLDRYRALVGEMSDLNVVELGIFRGGSAALAALEGSPRRLIVIDIEDRVDALDELIADRGWEHVRPYYRVDQSDQATLAHIISQEFATDHLDLVIDDASHLLDPSRASFELLFPLLRPGGRYLIEDWNSELLYATAFESIARNNPAEARALIEAAADPRHEAHRQAARVIARESDPVLRELVPRSFSPEVPGSRPLASIIAELAAAHSARPDAVAFFTVDGPWVTIVRGPAELPSPCSLAALGGWARHLIV